MFYPVFFKAEDAIERKSLLELKHKEQKKKNEAFNLEILRAFGLAYRPNQYLLLKQLVDYRGTLLCPADWLVQSELDAWSI